MVQLYLLVLQNLFIKLQRTLITLSDIQSDIFEFENLPHLQMEHFHQFLSNSQFSISSVDRKRGNMASCRVFFIEFSNDVSDELFRLQILRHENQLWPVNKVVVIVLEDVIFREAFYVHFLYVNKVLKNPLSNLYHL